MTTLAGGLMHAAGHVALAGAAGALARDLAGSGPLVFGGSMPLIAWLGGGDVLTGLAISGVCAAVLKTAGTTLAGWSEARIAGDVGASLRLEVMARVLSRHRLRGPRQSDHGEGAIRHSGADVAALTTHVHDVERGILLGVLGEVRALLQLLPLVGLLVWLAPRLAWSAVVVMASFGALVHVTRGALRRAHARAALQAEALVVASDEAIRHADLWVTYGASATIRSHLASIGRAISGTQARLRARHALLSGTSEVLGALALTLAMALTANGPPAGGRATLVPFAVAFFMGYRPLRELVDARVARARGEDALFAAHPRVDIAEASAFAAPKTFSLAPLEIRALVTARGRHPPLTLTVAPGSIVAIVGPTGVGKTSLVRTLLGLDSAVSGEVYYDGAPLEAHAVGPSARPFAWVPQDAPILAATLEENVALGAPGVEVGPVLASVGAAAFAADVGRGVLVAGRPVSGGERQLVAIARALATSLPVLVLDEPTSAMDNASQGVVLAALAALRGTRTILVVTHRPEPLAVADVVVRLDGG